MYLVPTSDGKVNFFGNSYQVFDTEKENPHLNQIGYLLSGFLVGLGTAYGGGCTSGHGICGLP